MQRSSYAAPRTLEVELLRFFDRATVECDGRVEQILVDGDPCERLEDELFRRHPVGLHRSLHIGDARLDDIKPDKLGAADLGIDGRTGDRDRADRDHQRCIPASHRSLRSAGTRVRMCGTQIMRPVSVRVNDNLAAVQE